MTNSKIKIGVKDGIHYIIDNDDNVEVVIYDYDINSGDELLDQDDLGNECIIDVLQ